MFSDESQFQLFRNDGRSFVRRRPGEAYRDDCVQPTLKHGGGSVMWGCMSEAGVGELRKVTGQFCAKDYVGILRGVVLLSICSLGLGSEYIFQQDNASCHSAKFTKNWMSWNNVALLDWPAQSPDLNPIEHLWDVVGRSLGSTKFSNEGKLWKRLQQEWSQLPRVTISHLVESMPRQIAAVIKALGGYTRY